MNRNRFTAAALVVSLLAVAFAFAVSPFLGLGVAVGALLQIAATEA